jgi:ribonuclease Z
VDLTLLGTGCPQCDPDRLGPANLIRHGDTQLLFDCGSGVTQRLVGAGSSGAKLDALFLTHLHTDHLVDFYQLVISSWHQGRDRPQRVFGPPGTRMFVEATMAVWREERAQRIAHELRPSVRAFEIEVTEIAAGQSIAVGDATVTAVAVEHQPVKHAFGFVVEAGRRRIVLSGDTRRCAALIDAARGADVLLHECFIHHEMKPAPGRTPEGLRNVAAYHTLSGEVGALRAMPACAAWC